VIPADLKPGDTLGRYEILMPVAKGGMAAVWAARLVGSRGFQKVVAIKTILPGLSDDVDFEAMLLDEARLAARIRHPHVVEIVDLGEEDEWLYLVMGWVDGETLFTLNKRAKQRGGIPLPILLRILSSACAGLEAAHELRDDKGQLVGLVHRDISPQNIMISFDGIVKIVDFGVAKAAGRSHETRVGGVMKGKVPYLSPEQLEGRKIDRRADLFSLGILAYVMVSGRHPFKGETDAKTMENICARAPVPLRDLVPDVNPELEAIVLRALEKDPDARWPSCAEMQRALDQTASKLGTSVTDGDVARFVRELMGDALAERNAALAEAIQRADARAATPAPAKAKPAARGGAPLPATFEGILPVALEDAAAPARVDLYTPAPAAPVTSSTLAPLAPGGARRRSPLGLLAVLLIAAAVALAVSVRMGKLPWLAERLPWLRASAAPR
jgi:serine/threonine-protein kinase